MISCVKRTVRSGRRAAGESRARRRFIPVLALLIALLVPPSALAQERTVTVSGTATQQVPNDSASLGFSVSKERRSRQTALRAVAIRLRGVIAAVQTVAGVGPGDIVTGSITIRKGTRGKRPIYRAGEGISVILHQPERAGELITTAIAAGATGSRGPRFFASDPGAAYRSALLAAFDQAKAKASALAAQAGATLGPAITIEEGAEFNPALPVATGRSRGGAPEPAPPVVAGTATVTATVKVVFALE
jgi:uncharacterized protein YggE